MTKIKIDLKELCTRCVKALATLRATKGWDAANRVAVRWSLWASKHPQRKDAEFLNRYGRTGVAER